MDFLGKDERLEVLVPGDTRGLTEEEIINIPLQCSIFIYSPLWVRRGCPQPCKICNKTRCPRYRRCLTKEEEGKFLGKIGSSRMKVSELSRRLEVI